MANDEIKSIIVGIEQLKKQNEEREIADLIPLVLSQTLNSTKAKTIMELDENLKLALATTKTHFPSNSVAAICDLFSFLVKRRIQNCQDFSDCKDQIIEVGKKLYEISLSSRTKIAEFAQPFIGDGASILVHGFSHCVIATLKEAAKNNKQFNIFVTEGRPSSSGKLVAQLLKNEGMPVTMIPDSAVARNIEKIDMILIGADVVAESGGVVSQIGAYQISITAAAFRKPFYVAVESNRFSRIYPLSQRDLPAEKINADLINQYADIGITVK
eukprot:TRINITY_DN353_c0_g1_i4.p1 TRINITY_DN353_c0_g1~~TRINITY_DN353_c0_g1_i4.p1  ORF type:complete len:271 (+),score=106.90 TRINITY_DN353_c0_g1_i4:88-900(+)